VSPTLAFADAQTARRPFSTAARPDIFYNGTWSENSTAAWVSDTLARTQQRNGTGAWPPPWQMPRRRALEVVRSPRYREHIIRALGAITQWRTITSTQLAAVTGIRTLAATFSSREASSAALCALFNLGIIEWGRPTYSPLQPRRSDTILYRPSKGAAFTRHVAPLLTWSELIAITGGGDFNASHQADRHNTLTVELALRAAELTETGTVIAEKHAALRDLAVTPTGRQIAGGAFADAVIVRPDGVRIAIELTASSSAYFSRKVERWAQLIEESPYDASGLIVCFVTVPPPYAKRGHGGGVETQTRSLVAAHSKSHPGSVRDRTANRMAIAAWQDWFPELGHYSDSFQTLTASRPVGPSASPWADVFLLDPFDVPTPRDSERLAAVIPNSWALAGTPDILIPERAAGLDLTSRALDSLSMRDDLIPPPSTGQSRPNRPRGALGVSGAPRVPPRLSWSPRPHRLLPTITAT
jgi:hypothetical protein